MTARSSRILAAITTTGRCVWECDHCRGAWRLGTPERLLGEHEETCKPDDITEKETTLTTQPERIPLDDLTSDQLDQLYARIDTLEAVCKSNKRAYVGAVRAAWAAEATVTRVRNLAETWTAAPDPLAQAMARDLGTTLAAPPITR